MSHYCTAFDQAFLAPGIALWRSLARHEPGAVLWVLALDAVTAELLGELADPRLRVVPLAELERDDPALVAAKDSRSWVEYVFTLSPCWPRWLMTRRPEIDRLTCLDADLFFFANPAPVHAAMDAAGASVLVTRHGFPPWLRHYERHGAYNVGFLSFRRDAAGLGCLDDWRTRCLAWCRDRVEDGKYADQGYLDEWPARLGSALLVLDHPGVNLAPWNWDGRTVVSRRWVEEGGLIAFHFARFRPLLGGHWWHSGQLDYGIMPWSLRQAIYGPYWHALRAARAEISAIRPNAAFPRHSARGGRGFWRALPLRLIFGGDWLRLGGAFWNLRFGLGRWSGRCLAALRNSLG